MQQITRGYMGFSKNHQKQGLPGYPWESQWLIMLGSPVVHGRFWMVDVSTEGVSREQHRRWYSDPGLFQLEYGGKARIQGSKACAGEASLLVLLLEFHLTKWR